ncbi:MAG: alkaline phosphatase family protein [Mycobacteriales bacterium]
MSRELTRRQLFAGTAATAAGLAMSRAGAATRAGTLPAPAASGLEHIVFVCMENRSFDHFLGWLPGATGRQVGLSYRDDHGVAHLTHHLTERQGCGFNDPDHSYEGGRTQFAAGRLDGFRKGLNDDLALGYYGKADLPFYGPLVGQATVLDHWFASTLSATYPNRFYTHAARTDRIDNTTRMTNMPTIWDRLWAAGVPATYYFSDLPFLALWGEKYLPISKPIGSFFTAAASGTLPQFSYLDPFFLGEEQGGSNDDHPHADIHRGQAFLSEVAAAVTTSPLWSKTALIITYDEWGGFFDHVRPPRFADDHVTGPGEHDHGQAGFRVPGFVLSPFAQRGAIHSSVYDHTSMLKMLEWRFGLAPLSARDRNARNLAEVLDFSAPRASIPALPVVVDPGPHICGAPGGAMATENSFWRGLQELKAGSAWRHVG